MPRKESLYEMRRWIMNVVVVPDGPDKGKFALIGHGKNDQGQMTIVELRIFEKYLDAVYVFDQIRMKKIRPEEVQYYEVTDKNLMTWMDRYAKALQ